MVTCERCYKAKVKCSLDTPCTRCLRMNKECTPRESKRKVSDSVSSGAPLSKRATLRRESGEVTISESSDLRSNGSRHYGTNWLIRSWIATAFRRRSFPLLSRAVTLAIKCGISMDQIFCGRSLTAHLTAMNSPMEYLKPILTMDTDAAQYIPQAISWEQIPFNLQQRVLTQTQNDNSTIESSWVMGMGFKDGLYSFYLSMAMERDVVSLSSIQAVYALNQREVVSLFLTESSVVTFHRALAKQTSLWLTSSSKPPLTVVRGQLETGTGHNDPSVEVCGAGDSAAGVTHIQPKIVDVVMSMGFEIVEDDEGYCLCIFSHEGEPSYDAVSRTLQSIEGLGGGKRGEGDGSASGSGLEDDSSSMTSNFELFSQDLLQLVA